MNDNPLLIEHNLPFGAPPLDLIRAEHFPPAFDTALEEHRREIREIAERDDPATFENTIEHLEISGRLLAKVRDLFFNLRSAHTNDGIQEVARDISPRLAAHRDEILFNRALFERVSRIWQERDRLGLNSEQGILLEETYTAFTRGGAALSEHEQEELGRINHRLSVLKVQFTENVLAANRSFELKVDDPEDLSGLPQASRSAAREEAERRGYDQGWVFTLDKPSLIPFLQYAERRELRQQIFHAYTERCRDGEHDNRPVIEEISGLRARRAELLGYPSHAAYVLEKSMAATPDQVDGLLHRLWAPAKARAEQEARELQAQIRAEGGDFELEPWDWWFYAERVRKARYDFDADALRPYFELDAVRRGLFETVGKLFGLVFEQRTDLPVYHEEVKAFEVRDREGRHIGLFYTDDHPRPSKQVGAWMDTFRDQWRDRGTDIRPHVINVCNLARPTGDKPALLSIDEVRTLYHELGHALHGLLARSTYRSLSGTRVPRDFVELPSQLMENWAFAPETLPLYAKHYETGEPIPQELVDKMTRAERFNQGFATVEYLAASFLDMAWHTLPAGQKPVTDEVEAEILDRLGIPPQILPRYRSTYFSHVFHSGYDAGYYSYIWAEVLDADAFEVFRESDLFDRELARSYRENILEKGHSEPPMDLYRRFRGADPEIEPLLARRGLQPVAAEV